MSGQSTLRRSALLLVGGFVTYVAVTFLHTGGPANEHEVIFDHYAGSDSWILVHLGQFAAMAAIVAGLLGLRAALFSVDSTEGYGVSFVAWLGSVASAVALGLYAVLQAVDGVALKHVVDAWSSSSAAERTARFADAEVVRWLEWGTRSYHSITLGLALLLLGSAVAWSRRIPRVLGYLMVLSGVAYVAQGWVLGFDGFSAANSLAIVAGYVLMLAWTASLVAIAWHPDRSAGRADERPDTVPL